MTIVLDYFDHQKTIIERNFLDIKKVNRKVQEVPQAEAAANRKSDID